MKSAMTVPEGIQPSEVGHHGSVGSSNGLSPPFCNYLTVYNKTLQKCKTTLTTQFGTLCLVMVVVMVITITITINNKNLK